MGNSHAKHEEKKHAKKPPQPPTAAEECAAPGSAKAPASGSRLRDAYHVESKILGEGHYGTVRRCSPRGDATKRFAVKSINKSRVHRPEMLKREVEIMKAVRHPNIIEVVEVFDEPDFLHIVTELCRGGELFDRIIAKTSSREKHFSEADAVGILAQILEAVGYCHGLEPPVVHRDLKPENFLFVTEADDAAVKIIDFGLSKYGPAGEDHMHTRVGTPYYIAPEVLKRDYTLKCDIWSVGVIAYILLCGYPPFFGDNDKEIFRRVSAGSFTFPSPEWDHISGDAKAFVSTLLDLDPEKRPTAAAALEDKWMAKHDDHHRAHVSRHASNPAVLAAVARRMERFVHMAKLKRLALNVLSRNLTGREIKDLRRVFEAIDRDRSGKISSAEPHDALKPHLERDHVDAATLLRAVDISGDHEIDYNEFLAATMQRNLYQKDDNVKKVFAQLDLDGTGCITVANLVEITGSKKHAMELLDEADLDHDHKISYAEFKALMLKK